MTAMADTEEILIRLARDVPIATQHEEVRNETQTTD
jgi:hypothetical protein